MLPLTSMAQSTSQSNITPNSNIKGALCFIQADDQVVFVDEMYTKRLSLPGGTIEAGEDPAKAAERETWEETGLVVHAKERLTQTDTAVVYHCEPASGVIAFSTRNVRGFHPLPSWFAPSFSVEVKQVFLGYPDAIDAQEYRYPEQFLQQVLNHDVPNAPIQYIHSAQTAASMMHQEQFPWLEQIQRVVFSLPEPLNQHVIQLLSFFNHAFAGLVFIFLIPILMHFIGGRYFNRMMLLIMVTGFICLLMQLGLKYPKPYIYQPNLQMIESTGFATPSLSSTLAIVIIGYFFTAWRRIHQDESIARPLMLGIVIVLLQGMISVILGEHFFTDVLFAYVLGLFALWHFVRMEHALAIRKKDPFAHPILWWLVALGLGAGAFVLHSLSMTNITAMALALALVHKALLATQPQSRVLFGVKLLICWSISAGLIELQGQWFEHVHFGSAKLSYFMQSGLWFVLTYLSIKISSIHIKTSTNVKTKEISE